MKVDLPDGTVVQLRDSVTLGQRNLIQQRHSDLIKAIVDRYGSFAAWEQRDAESWGAPLKAAFQDWHKFAVVTMVESWTREEPLPTMDTVEEMDPADFDLILEQANEMAMQAVRGLAFGPSGQRDPKADTDGSPDSAGSSATEAQARSTSRTKKP